ECVCLGAAVRIVGPDLMPIKDEPRPLDHETIDCETLTGFGAAIRHPVAIFRADAIRSINGYREEYLTHEDADLYLRLAEIGRLANLPDILLLYRWRLGSCDRTRSSLWPRYAKMAVQDARIRRGLSIVPDIANLEQASIRPDDGRASWAAWSYC